MPSCFPSIFTFILFVFRLSLHFHFRTSLFHFHTFTPLLFSLSYFLVHDFSPFSLSYLSFSCFSSIFIFTFMLFFFTGVFPFPSLYFRALMQFSKFMKRLLKSHPKQYRMLSSRPAAPYLPSHHHLLIFIQNSCDVFDNSRSRFSFLEF